MLKILREPLLHFLLLGAVFFLAYFWLNPSDQSSSDNQIHVSQNDIDRFVSIFQKQWNRKPTKQEMDGLVRAHLKEEILYREALALGLEKDDTIVRRRLAQKMEFLITDVVVPGEVEDKELMVFYQKHPERYTRAARMSFRHIYFNPDQRGERLLDEANATLSTLQATNAGVDVPEGYGDRFMLQLQYSQQSIDQIARMFGGEFADKLVEVTPGYWQGPIRSGYGVHLVYIQQRDAASIYPFSEVRERLKNDYLFDLRQTRNEEMLEKLKTRYEITIAPY
ncbi:MAG: peptidylprolyl isomerase [Gammaproteobacteria bacterium]|nr:peptidylprolyl isomerase [Gammaproteobacteria bacterium]